MSIIHKALKRSADAERDPVLPIDPEDALYGGGGGGFSRPPNRRLVTLVLAVLTAVVAGFVVYQKFWGAPSNAPQPAEVAIPVIPRGLSGASGQSDAGVAAADAGLHPDNAGLPRSIAGLVDQGETLYNGGKYAEALAQFLQAAEKEPKLAMIWNNIGLAHKKLKNFDEAEMAYGKALELDAHYAEAMNNRGMLKVAQGDALAAGLYFRQAIAQRPEYADAHFNLAVLMEEEGNWRSAVAEYKLFLTHASGRAEPLLEQVTLRIEELAP